MEGKNTCVMNTVLWVAGLLLLLAAAFDVLPMQDNQVIFLAIACFIIAAALKKFNKDKGSCCK